MVGPCLIVMAINAASSAAFTFELETPLLLVLPWPSEPVALPRNHGSLQERTPLVLVERGSSKRDSLVHGKRATLLGPSILGYTWRWTSMAKMAAPVVLVRQDEQEDAIPPRIPRAS